MTEVPKGTSDHDQPSGGSAVPRGRPRVLVALGERATREGLMGILERAHYVVQGARDSDEALAVLNTGEVDAIVVSFGLPPEGCGSLLGEYRGPLPAVVLRDMNDDVEAIATDPRVQSVLTRPFPLQDLYGAVAKATNGTKTD